MVELKIDSELKDLWFPIRIDGEMYNEIYKISQQQNTTPNEFVKQAIVEAFKKVYKNGRG